MKIAKVVLINIIVFLCLLFAANAISAWILDRREVQRSMQDGRTDQRIKLPAYADKAFAESVFEDFYKTQNAYNAYEDLRLRPYSGVTTQIDANGIRRTIGQPENAAGFIRLFGGSTMWGTGSDDANTIASLVQREFPDRKVVNHGQSGWTSGQSLTALLKLIRADAPLGTVVFYDGVNDIFLRCMNSDDLENTSITNFIRELIASKRESHRFLDVSLGSILELMTGTRITTTTQISEIRAAGCTADPKRAEEIVKRMLANWKIAKDLVEANGGTFVAVLQPVSSVGTPARDYLAATPEWDAWYRAGYARVQSSMAQYGWMHDLSNALDGPEPIYIDWCHVTPKGNSRVAARLTPILKETIARAGTRPQ